MSLRYKVESMEQKRLNLLLVEDSGFAAAMIREKLSTMPFLLTIEQVDTLQRAKDCLDSEVFDLVITDLHLPDGMGSELLPSLRRDAECPIIVLTSHGGEKAAVDAIKRGALDFLVKSKESLEKLPHIVDRVLREWQIHLERRRFEDALRLSEERFRSLFTMVAAGMVVLDEERKMIQVNPAFCDFLGYTETELKTMRIEDVTHPDDRQQTVEYYNQLFSRDSLPFHYEKSYRRKDGKEIWGHVSASRLKGYEASGGRFCVALVQDISSRVHTERQLQEVNKELDAFVYTISHDLRSSLTPMINIPDLLRERMGDAIDSDSDQLLECVEEQAYKMLTLMEDLLNLAQAGSINRPEEAVDTGDIVHEVVNTLSEKAVAKGVSIEVGRLEPIRIPDTFLAQIFTNLIGNAIAYGSEEAGKIKVGSDQQKRLIRYYVRDYGAGIDDQEKEQIFNLFYRAGSSRGKKGTGIGLAIVHKIVKTFDGKIWVTDSPGGGSTFWIEFPRF